MPTNTNVTEDRYLYIGGSDIPVIMGISQFRTRWELLNEKAFNIDISKGYQVDDDYKDYGTIMEHKIRNYINETMHTNFEEATTITKEEVIDSRYNADGLNEDAVLEIKTVSQVKEDARSNKKFVCQLLYGMLKNKKEHGILAIYERTLNEDGMFNMEFDSKYLHIINININDYRDWIDDINISVNLFKNDLQRLREEPYLDEEDLQTNQMIVLSTKVSAFELKIREMKEFEKQLANIKEQLYMFMSVNSIRNWKSEKLGITLSLVESKPDQTIEKEFLDIEQLQKEFPTVYHQCLKTKQEVLKGKKGCVRILVKEKKEEQ